MTNERIIFNEVCTHYDALQRHDLVSRFYTAEQVERYTAGLKFEPDGNGNTPDPVEAAEAFLCSKLFHTWAEWHKEGLTVKKGEKAAITCELWKLSDKKKQPKPDADELTKAAAEQDKGYYYLAKAHLFHRGQVEKQQPRPVVRFKSLDDIRAYHKMLADQRKAAKAAAQQDKPQTEKAKPAPAPKQETAPSAADLKKAECKAMHEFMAVSAEDRPAQAKALAKWREARQAVADVEKTPKSAAPAPAPKPEAKPQPQAAPAPSADNAPAYCEQTSFC